MAYPDQEQEDNPEADGEKLQSAAGTTLSGYSSPTSTQQDKQSGMQTNLQSYIDQNKQQTGEMTDKIIGGFQDERANYNKDLSSGADTRRAALDKYANDYSTKTSGVMDMFNDPTGEWSGPNRTWGDNLERARGVLAGNTPNRPAYGSMSGLDQRASDMSGRTEALNNSQGRLAALKRYQMGSATGGGDRLNRMLMKNDPLARDKFATEAQQYQAPRQAYDQARANVDAYSAGIQGQVSSQADLNAQRLDDLYEKTQSEIAGFNTGKFGLSGNDQRRINSYRSLFGDLGLGTDTPNWMKAKEADAAADRVQEPVATYLGPKPKPRQNPYLDALKKRLGL